MYSNLKNLGINDVSSIERYKIREEGTSDTLKIYFCKQPGSFLARSIKFKFKRQTKKTSGGTGTSQFTQVSQINSTLFKIVKELDNLSLQTKDDKEVKQQILDDLHHLERVVNSKIKEIEAKLDLI